MQSQSLPGFRDFYPDDTALRNQIFAAWREVAARYGFEEYDGPPLEPLELYTEKSGPEIVAQLYAFEDKGGRRVALRPEMTPTLARMVAARAQGLKKPIRWFSLPQLFRYERQQRGRLREHFQLNMDLIGEPGPLADAEIIGAALDVQRVLGLGSNDVRVRVSDRRVIGALLSGIGLTPASLATAYAVIDKIERVSAGESRKHMLDHLSGHPAYKGWKDARREEVADRVLQLGRVRGRGALEAELDRFPGGDVTGEPLLTCLDALGDLGFGEYVEPDLSIVRGLAYYTGIVFELFDAGKSLRAVCGGGRYDGLLKALGGVDLPAVGFGMGDVVLGELLKDRGLARDAPRGLDVFLVAITSDDQPHVLRLARVLRDAGASAEFALKQQSIAKQLKLAAARPARFAVIVGPDERAQDEVVLRDLAAGVEERVATAEVVGRVVNGEW